MNGWTPPRTEIEAVEALFALPSPWRKGTAKPQQLVDILDALFASVTDPSAAATFVEDLYRERYAELVLIGELKLTLGVSCASGGSATVENDPSVALFATRAQELAYRLPPENAQTWLFNYCEALAFDAVDSRTELVASLIHMLPSCLRDRMKSIRN